MKLSFFFVKKKEVFDAFSSMESFKALRPDGFQPFLFKEYWDVIGDDVFKLAQDAFSISSLTLSWLRLLLS